MLTDIDPAAFTADPDKHRDDLEGSRQRLGMRDRWHCRDSHFPGVAVIGRVTGRSPMGAPDAASSGFLARTEAIAEMQLTVALVSIEIFGSGRTGEIARSPQAEFRPLWPHRGYVR